MRVYFNLLFVVLGLGGVALALATRVVAASAPAGATPLVALGVMALLGLGASLLSPRRSEGDLGLAALLIALGAGGAWLVGRLEPGSPLLQALLASASGVLPPLIVALRVWSRPGQALSAELVRDLIASEGPLENTLIALSLGGAEALEHLAAELERSEGPRRLRCVSLLGAFPLQPRARDLAKEAARSDQPALQAAGLEALQRIDPGAGSGET